MRVALLTKKWSVRGGNERQAVELARYLAGRGADVRIVCQKDDGTHDLDLPVERLPGIRFDPTASMVTWVLAAKRAVRRLRTSGAVDVVVGFNQSVLQDVFRLGGGTHAAYLEATAEDPSSRGGPVLDRLALRFERERVHEKNTHLFIAPCARVGRELERHYRVDPARIRVIMNGVDLDRYRPEGPPGERAEVRRRWGVDERDDVALFVGHNPHLKGLDLAAAAAERAGVKLVYVGRATPPAERPPWLIWDGERADLESAYRAADLLLLPARFDTFGGVVLEAYASGLPAVATDLIGATDLAAGTDLEGLLIRDPEDVEGLVDRVKRALGAERAELGRQARAIAEGRTLARWGEEMAETLEEIGGGAF